MGSVSTARAHLSLHEIARVIRATLLQFGASEAFATHPAVNRPLAPRSATGSPGRLPGNLVRARPGGETRPGATRPAPGPPGPARDGRTVGREAADHTPRSQGRKPCRRRSAGVDHRPGSRDLVLGRPDTARRIGSRIAMRPRRTHAVAARHRPPRRAVPTEVMDRLSKGSIRPRAKPMNDRFGKREVRCLKSFHSIQCTDRCMAGESSPADLLRHARCPAASSARMVGSRNGCDSRANQDKPKVGRHLEEGPFLDGQLTLSVEANRIDWVLGPIVTPNKDSAICRESALSCRFATSSQRRC